MAILKSNRQFDKSLAARLMWDEIALLPPAPSKDNRAAARGHGERSNLVTSSENRYKSTHDIVRLVEVLTAGLEGNHEMTYPLLHVPSTNRGPRRVS